MQTFSLFGFVSLGDGFATSVSDHRGSNSMRQYRDVHVWKPTERYTHTSSIALSWASSGSIGAAMVVGESQFSFD